MVEARPRRLYICLRCGNKFWSRAKKPQCPVCKSKRVMLYEDFEKLSDEEKAELLPGLFSVPKDGGKSAKEGENEGELEIKDVGEVVMEVETERENKDESGGKPGKEAELRGEERLKPVERGRVKESEPVRGERVKPHKKPLAVKLPKLSLKAWGILAGLAFVWYLYHIGWFDEMFRQLRSLGAWGKALEEREEEDKPVVKSGSPILGKIESNLRRG